MSKLDVVHDSEMKWPAGWDRTRIQDRKTQASWKGTFTKYADAAAKELGLLGATSVLISVSKNERLDPGVAIWFSRKKQDYSWQEALGLDTPAPTLVQIDDAFRTLSRKYHPDNPDGGDIEMFKKLGEHRRNARDWVTGAHDHEHDYVLASDRYTEVRHNVAALRKAFAAFRALESVGVPAILERSLDRFKQALTTGGPSGQP